METKEYIESGILELYVYGLLESENESSTKSKESLEINSEMAIESIVSLSSSFPFYRLTMRQYERN
jgi:hypothetical protein